MLSIIVLLAAVPVRYAFTPALRASYGVEVRFDGYLPVLGGKEGKIGVDLGVAVEGLNPTDDGKPRVASEIREFKMTLNGAPTSFTAKNVALFFPRTTVDLTPEGKMLKTDAPNRKLPVRLPGLDAKRFPDITYLPIEFPATGIEEGKPFKFRKPLGDTEMEFEATPTKIADDKITLAVKLSQTYVTYEDQSGNPVDEASASVRVGTEVTGEGTAAFDRKRGLFKEVDIVSDALAHAVDLASKKQSDRKLRTTLKIVLK
ncbi:hypothetical protein [Fimbriimonas ginsengisoli]|uniref:Uncharacterized protein n=1 Tax=Fimbriimonas ginsengisoli Gsoil 348 TaxID=661478 RepID=A0A068NVE9_FIMGI|nr:hypothetical protein [Fimbriimonas ginsengisoli]AIE87426.1 hypothetical protein OP10G_4058 [Fimbriimonas ginsengisoli Gsoil 348]